MKKWKVVGYCITRGFDRVYIYNEETKKWHENIKKMKIYNLIEDASYALSKIEKYKNTAKLQEVIDHNDGTLGFMIPGGLEELRNIKKLLAPRL
ncbi:hypothetical protein HGO23_10105 [Xenorhabdus budapestensis]|uniref:Uncharacterized protein n=1 Tax=Xenorhabdus budapestensis TaxID=290110 RepID=A0ABX7VCM0_XENBU|nr:hypothetical protein [Xenorhabdus budapestensis]QTL38290.1 hypothetical protein HGO23_10105 [Xenorhabdus budapestensis]